MNIKVSGGVQEDGIVIGNTYDKYNSRNPIVKWMMNGFHEALSDLVSEAKTQFEIKNPNAELNIHEIGCGEGYWVMRWNEAGLNARGCDFSKKVIELAKENAIAKGINPDLLNAKNIYELDANDDKADLVVCCEVLEHLEDPRAGLAALQKITQSHLIISVPREPIWCGLNLVRGKYISDWGNTPGHIQHWSKQKFVQLVSEYFEIENIKSPLPWTMLLCKPRL